MFNEYDDVKSENVQEWYEEPVSVKEWITTGLTLMIPFVNIFLIFYYAFSRKSKRSKANYFRAALIMFVFVAILTIMATAGLGSLINITMKL